LAVTLSATSSLNVVYLETNGPGGHASRAGSTTKSSGAAVEGLRGGVRRVHAAAQRAEVGDLNL